MSKDYTVIGGFVYINSEIEMPKERPRSCKDCPFTREYEEDIHMGCGGYDRETFLECKITEDCEQITTSRTSCQKTMKEYTAERMARLFSQCPLKLNERGEV